jgi:adenylate kinase
MKCLTCEHIERKNTWTCRACGRRMEGGVVFVTGVSGSSVDTYLHSVGAEAQKPGHEHAIQIHDVGRIMQRFAEQDDPNVQWQRILDADKPALRHLRARAFDRLREVVLSNLTTLHIVDLHLSFKWTAVSTLGFDPHNLFEFEPYTRCFVNIIEDLSKIQQNLSQTSWGHRDLRSLLNWRCEEDVLTRVFSAFFGRLEYFLLVRGEPPLTLERMIWHPEMKKVYLSFPITNIVNDIAALNEIAAFRDEIREFLVVFNPHASKDYDEVYLHPRMKKISKDLADVVVDRDYRLIDQSDAVVVYYPRLVASKGVDAEMIHAKRAGKPIYLYCPEDLGGGPFATLPDHSEKDPQSFITFLRDTLASPPTAREV